MSISCNVLFFPLFLPVPTAVQGILLPTPSHPLRFLFSLALILHKVVSDDFNSCNKFVSGQSNDCHRFVDCKELNVPRDEDYFNVNGPLDAKEVHFEVIVLQVSFL